MKNTHRILILMSLALVTAGGLRSQTTTGTTTNTTTGTTTGTSTGGTSTGTTTGTSTGTSTGTTTTTGGTTATTTTGGSAKASGKAKGPNENASANAKAVHAVIAKFQAERDTYLAARKLLLAKLGTATEAEKKAILEQLRADKAAREDEERSLGKQIREELKKLRGERKSGPSS